MHILSLNLYQFLFSSILCDNLVINISFTITKMLFDLAHETLEMMAQRDPAAAAAQKYKPIQSAVPGTTLGPIQIDAFLGGGVCIISSLPGFYPISLAKCLHFYEFIRAVSYSPN